MQEIYLKHIERNILNGIPQIIGLFFFLIIQTVVHGQTISPQSLSTSGAFYQNQTGSLSVTIGQSPPVETVANQVAGFIFTQGFQQNDIGYALPVKLISFEAEKKEFFINLKWRVTNESGISQYTVQRSSDLQNYKDIGSLNAVNISSNENNYTIKDNDNPVGVNYYRIQIKENDGRIWYSWIIKVSSDLIAPGFINVFPVPASDIVYVEYSSTMQSNKPISFYNILGELLWKRSETVRPGINLIMINISDYPAGTYLLSGLDKKGIRIIKK